MSAGRVCGTCNFCCKVMEIAELAKPAGQWCAHSPPGKGCGIYGDRPQSCRDFSCLWLLDERLPDHFRPDRTKVVLGVSEDGGNLVAHCEPASPLAWQREPILGLLKAQARKVWGSDFKVFARSPGHLWWVAPHQDFDLGDIDPEAGFSLAYDGTTVTVSVPDA